MEFLGAFGSACMNTGGVNLANCLCEATKRACHQENVGEEIVNRRREANVRKDLSRSLAKEYMEEDLKKLMKLLHKERQTVVAVTGPMSIGKTTLLARLNNELCRRSCLDLSAPVVLFVDDVQVPGISQDLWIKAVQDSLETRLSMNSSRNNNGDGTNPNADRRAARIRDELKNLNFVIIIDNMMSGVDWNTLGIPLSPSERHCAPCGKDRYQNVVFAPTNTEELNSSKYDYKVEMNPVDDPAAWKLFQSMLQRERQKKSLHRERQKGSYDPPNLKKEIEEIAKRLVTRNRLPADILRLAQAIAPNINNIEFCRKYETRESNSSSTTRLDDIFSQRPKEYRSCYLFICLFHTDHLVTIENLVHCWICDGLLENVHIGERAYNFAKANIVEALNDWGLIQQISSPDGVPKARMMYEEGASTLAKRERSEVQKGMHLTTIDRSGSQNQQPIRASFVDNDIRRLDGTGPEWPELKTLFLSHNKKLQVISDDYFRHMTSLQVLDLSHTNIVNIPSGIGCLSTLQYLNLSYTRIQKLPTEVIKLSSLRQLHLEGNHKLKEMPPISSNEGEQLEGLNLYDSYSGWTTTQSESITDGGDILQLLALHKLKCLAITISSHQALNGLLESNAMRERCEVVNRLMLKNCQGITTIHIPRLLTRLPQLQVLSVSSCSEVAQFIVDAESSSQPSGSSVNPVSHSEDDMEPHSTGGNLQFLSISGLIDLREVRWNLNFDLLTSLSITECNKIQDVTWVTKLPFLEYVSLLNCAGLNIIVARENVEDALPSLFIHLKEMKLQSLPNLQRICSDEIIMPCPLLELIIVDDCPKLTKLPLPKLPPQRFTSIEGAQTWWDKLDWTPNVKDYELKWSRFFYATKR